MGVALIVRLRTICLFCHAVYLQFLKAVMGLNVSELNIFNVYLVVMAILYVERHLIYFVWYNTCLGQA